MDFLSVVIGIASHVLGQTIADLISGKTQAARKAEIEYEVSRILLEQKVSESHELKLLITDIMTEIDVLSRRDPDLVVTPRQIRLRDMQPPSRSESQVDREMFDKLFRLGKIIEQRRDELGLPSSRLEKSPAAFTENTSKVIDVEWETVAPRQLPSHWEQEFKEMEERIRRLRSQD